MNIKIGMISLGCAKNLVDSEHMLALLRQSDCCIVEDLTQAEVIIINTCGFIESAKQEAIDTILQTALLKKNGQLKKMIVTGCLAERYRQAILEELPEVDAILGTGSYTHIVTAVQEVMQEHNIVDFAAPASAALEGERSLLTPAYTAYLKIAEGCSNRCGYCIIPKLRGPYRSRPRQALLQEAQKLADSGVKELIIIAQDITKYGIDIDGKRQLPALLKALCAMPFTWIRLHYLYPDQITDELIEVIAQEPKIVKYLDIPLQHVAPRILRAMHRPGSRDEFTRLIHTLRARIPKLVLRTSLIVGLPGETEEEFTQLCEFLQEVAMERVGVFEFSPEDGTEAAEMPDQIDEQTKQERRLIVEELQSAIMDEYYEQLLQQEMTVLCEGWDAQQQMYYGRTYADSIDVDGMVYFSAPQKIMAGKFVRVRIEESDGVALIGTLLEEEAS